MGVQRSHSRELLGPRTDWGPMPIRLMRTWVWLSLPGSSSGPEPITDRGQLKEEVVPAWCSGFPTPICTRSSWGMGLEAILLSPNPRDCFRRSGAESSGRCLSFHFDGSWAIPPGAPRLCLCACPGQQLGGGAGGWLRMFPHAGQG